MSETIENPLEEKKEESVELKESANPSVEINKNEESANSQERKIDSQLVKKVLDYEIKIKELELSIEEYKKNEESTKNIKLEYDMLLNKFNKQNSILNGIQNESTKEINQLKLDIDLLKQQLESKEKLLDEHEKNDHDYTTTIQNYEQDIKQFKEEMLKYKQSYETEHQVNETLQRDYSELNKEYSEQVANYSLLETKYNTLESSLKTHFYQSKAQDQEDHQQESNVQTITNYINEIQKLENVFNSKLNDYNQKEQQWKIKEGEYISKYNAISKELSDLNNKYLQYQSASNIKLAEVQKQLSNVTIQFEEYKLNYQLHDEKITYEEYKKLEEKYNRVILDFKKKEDELKEQLQSMTNTLKEAEQEKQSLMARIHQVEEFEAKLKQEEEELAKKQNEEKKDPEKEELMKEEAFLKSTEIFRNCYPTVDSPAPRKWTDPELKMLVGSLSQTNKNVFTPWYTNLIRSNNQMDPTPCTLEGLPEPMYHSIVTILLPILNTIPNYHVTAQSRKHYTLSYDMCIYPLPIIEAPSAAPSVIDMVDHSATNGPVDVHIENTPEMLLQSLNTTQNRGKSKKLWKWNN